ncbi:MAG: twin-arginine translocase subunit TatC [Bacteroidales bacterium]|nr:twin-arginine translocase subunit TatC [Bacteroidales bacterium]
MKNQKKNKTEELLTFGGHLEVFRKMLFRVIFVTFLFAFLIFCFKEQTFTLLLAPRKWNFITYRTIENILQTFGWDFHFNPYHIKMISTDLSAQFMTHLSTSIYLGLLIASPYILWELFRFTIPALNEKERKNSVGVAVSMYLLFAMGVLMNYFIIFPVSFRFLGTYQVDPSIESTITLASYIKTFSTLTFVMGLVFQLPVVSFILAKMGVLNADFLRHYRKHAFIIIMLVSAIITPPDLFTLFLVSLPMYLLYEICIIITNKVSSKK